MSTPKNVIIMSFFKKIGKSLLNKKSTQFRSSRYWENRYKSGGTSGSGSYSNLASFKSKVINGFVNENKIKTVVEFGCGDGNQLSLSGYPNYVGYDVSKSAINHCKKKFESDRSKKFFLYPTKSTLNIGERDLALSLDVIFHLTEDDVFEQYMHRLYNSSTKYVIVYSSNFNQQNIPHVRHREFTKWVSENINGWKLIKTIKNDFPFKSEEPDNTSNSDFFIYLKDN